MKIRFVRHIVLLVGVLFLFGCSPVTLKEARTRYALGDYHASVEVYKKLYRKCSPKKKELRGTIASEMGLCYAHLSAGERAKSAFSNAVRLLDADIDLLLAYAKALHYTGDYDKAEEVYQEILNIDSNNIESKRGLLSINISKELLANPSIYIVKREEVLNSNRGEFAPIFSPCGGELYFSSSRRDALGDDNSRITGVKNNDIYIAKKNEKGEWQRPIRIDTELNSELDEGTPSISPDCSTMFYTLCEESEDVVNTAKIFISKFQGGKWGRGELLQMSPDSSILFAHPSISPDGKTLYFVSDRKGGYGGKDIWKANLMDDNKIGYIMNMGPEINTPGDELFPYVHNDSTLYFSSNGHPGLGGLDIFKATKSARGEEWIVENMGVPINSSNDDFGIAIEKDADRGLFSSNRRDARGLDHIYSFEFPTYKSEIEGFVFSKDDEPIMEATVTVVNNKGEQQRLITNKDGFYHFAAERGVDYLFQASAKGFLNLKRTLSTDSAEKDSLYYVDFELSADDRPVVLKNIYYDFDKATLRPESKEELDAFISLLNDNPNVTIELSSHTDRKGRDEYNVALSLRRAESVINYLISNGIDKDRLKAEGYGSSRPQVVTKQIKKLYDSFSEGDILSKDYIETLSSEMQEQADQINRRTEFIVTSILMRK